MNTDNNPKEKHMEKFEEMKSLVLSLETDFKKFFEHQNQAAGIRVRGQMQKLKKLAQEVRQDVLERKPKRL